jgi:nitroreductase
METNILKDAHSIIYNQKSIQPFTGEQVNKEDIDKLLHAAMIAPAVMRMLPWKFIIIQDRTTLKVLAEKIPFSNVLLKAGTGIAVCVLPEETALSNEATAIEDCIVGSENILSAAEDLELAAACINIYPDKNLMNVVRATLNIPQKVIPVNLVAVGHSPNEEKLHFTRNAKAWFKKMQSDH